MSRPAGDRPLVAIALPRPDAALAVTACWDRDEAVIVLDPSAPARVFQRILDLVLDAEGRLARTDGIGAAAGTAAVVLTSGTTGEPKAVELTVDGLECIGTGFALALGTEGDDRWLVCLPLHHVAGLAILARARVSGAGVLVHPGFELDAVGAAPDTEQVTLTSLVPTMLLRLLDAGAPLHRYRSLVIGGAAMSPSLRARAQRVGAPIVDSYGLTETWGGVALDGVPVEGAQVRLGDDSEVLIRGPMVMRGYRCRDDDTARVFTCDGWLRTGDVGSWDPHGRLRVVDRVRDLIISGGVNVSPTAVEAALAEHPDIADIAVAGGPDAEWGERVVAFVVATDPGRAPTLEELRAFGRDRLGAAQLPRQVVVVEEIPRTPGGKARRRDLRMPA